MSDWQMIRLAPPLPKAKPRKPVAVINQAQADLNKDTANLYKVLDKLAKEIEKPEYEYTYEITRDKWDEPEFVKKNIDDRSGFGGAFLPPDRNRPVSRGMQRAMDSQAMTAKQEHELHVRIRGDVKEFKETINSFFKNLQRKEPVRLDGLTDYMRMLENGLCELHAQYGAQYPKLFREAEREIVTYYEQTKTDYETGWIF